MRLYDKRPPHDVAHDLVKRRIDAARMHLTKADFGLEPDEKYSDHFELVPIAEGTSSMISGREYRNLQWGVRVNGRAAGRVSSNYEGTRHKFLPGWFKEEDVYDPAVHGEPEPQDRPPFSRTSSDLGLVSHFSRGETQLSQDHPPLRRQAAAHPYTQQDWYHGGEISDRELSTDKRWLGHEWLHVGTQQAALDRIDPREYDPPGDFPSLQHSHLYRVRISPGARVCPHTHPDPMDNPNDEWFYGHGDYDVHSYTNRHEDPGSTSLVVRPSKVRIAEDLGQHPQWQDPAIRDKWHPQRTAAVQHLPNPYTGGKEWYHGTRARMDIAEHGLADPADFAHTRFETPESESDEPGHWNRLLGTHFTADHAVAREFAHGEHTNAANEGYSDDDWDEDESQHGILHAHLHIRNPKVYASEHDIDHEAYEHEFAAGNHPMNHLRDYEERYDDPEEGKEEREEMWPHAMRVHRNYGESEIPRSTFGEFHTPFQGHPMRTAWLNTHPDKIGIADRFKARLKAAGHDGVIYRNEYETTRRGAASNTSAIVFDPKQAEITQHHDADDFPEHDTIGQRQAAYGDPYERGKGPYMAQPDDAHLQEHLTAYHKLDPEHWRYGVSEQAGIAHWRRWHAAEHSQRAHETHQHEQLRGVPLEEKYPDVHRIEGDAPDVLGQSGGRARAPWERGKPLETGEFVPREMRYQSAAGGAYQGYMRTSDLTPRDFFIDREHAREIADDMRQNGWRGPGIPVRHDKAEGRTYIKDGHHRYAAAMLAGMSMIPVRGRGAVPPGLLTGQHMAAWAPSSGIFGPTTGLDPELFDSSGDGGESTLRPEVRRDVMERLDQALRVDSGVAGSDWQDWLRVYLAGGSASEWAGPRPGDQGARDLDILIGVDYSRALKQSGAPGVLDPPGAGGVNSPGGLADAELDARLNRALREHFNDQAWRPGFGGTWSLTGYVNPHAWDITSIRPYAAYDLTNMEWSVRPPHLPGHSAADFPQALLAQARAVASEARAVLRLPEPFRTQQARAMWARLHAERRRAFSIEGEGWVDPGNVIEKFLAYSRGHILEKIRDLALSG